MDIQKSQRLSRHLGLLSDMVKFSDISSFLAQSGTLSMEESCSLQNRLEFEGNSVVMQELLTMINLRRGGFNALLTALRESDYAWIAEQLDPGRTFTGTPSKSNEKQRRHIRRPSLVANVRQRLNRKSEPAISNNVEETDTIFTSYRESCPIDIPINPSFYAHLNKEDLHSAVCSSQDNIDKSETIAGNYEANSLFKKLRISSADNHHGKQAIIYNVDRDQMSNGKSYFSDLAKKANVPSPIVKGLKVIRCRRILKTKLKKPAVKLKFKTESGRNKFVENITAYISTLEPSDIQFKTLAQLEVAVPDEKSVTGNSKTKSGKVNKQPNPNSTTLSQQCMDVEDSNTRQNFQSQIHWFQNPFKSWSK